MDDLFEIKFEKDEEGFRLRVGDGWTALGVLLILWLVFA
jgi:hypothetical protein